MKRWVYLYLFMSMIMTLAACAPELDPEEPCNFIQNSLQRRVSWQVRPVSIAIESTFPEEFRESLQAALDRWEESINKDIFSDSIAVIDRSQAQDVNIALVWEEVWNSDASEQAKTRVSSQGDEIFSSIIYFNSEKEFSVDLEPMKIHMESLMIHEIGHALGLGHIDSQDSVMFPSLATNHERTELAPIDIESISCEY